MSSWRHTHLEVTSTSWTYVNPTKGRLFPENSFLVLKFSMDRAGGSCSNSTKFEVSSMPFTTGTKGGMPETHQYDLLLFQQVVGTVRNKSLTTDLVLMFTEQSCGNFLCSGCGYEITCVTTWSNKTTQKAVIRACKVILMCHDWLTKQKTKQTKKKYIIM